MRKGFTLVELIFVIVIIGILAAAAIPQFTNLKQSAEANNVLKIVSDAESSIPAAYINLVDLEDQNVTEINATVNITGKGWSLANTNTAYIYTDPVDNVGQIASITLSGRTLTTVVDCAQFNDPTSQTKCAKALDSSGGVTTKTNTINF